MQLKKKQAKTGLQDWLVINSRRKNMGKKYLDTKKNSLEQSILGVWKTAVEEGSGRMDGRTSEYREHRKKMESARSRRESSGIKAGALGALRRSKFSFSIQCNL